MIQNFFHKLTMKPVQNTSRPVSHASTAARSTYEA